MEKYVDTAEWSRPWRPIRLSLFTVQQHWENFQNHVIKKSINQFWVITKIKYN